MKKKMKTEQVKPGGDMAPDIPIPIVTGKQIGRAHV